MKAPDKVYIGIDDMGSGYVYNLSLDNNGHPEYIRKEALLEWLENKIKTIKMPDSGFVSRLTYLVYQDVIEHLNEM